MANFQEFDSSKPKRVNLLSSQQRKNHGKVLTSTLKQDRHVVLEDKFSRAISERTQFRSDRSVNRWPKYVCSFERFMIYSLRCFSLLLFLALSVLLHLHTIYILINHCEDWILKVVLILQKWMENLSIIQCNIILRRSLNWRWLFLKNVHQQLNVVVRLVSYLKWLCCFIWSTLLGYH